MNKQKAIKLMVRGNKMVSDDIGFHFFYVMYQNGCFVNHLGEVIDVNAYNGTWKIYNPKFRDKIKAFLVR